MVDVVTAAGVFGLCAAFAVAPEPRERTMTAAGQASEMSLSACSSILCEWISRVISGGELMGDATVETLQSNMLQMTMSLGSK